MTNEVVRKSFYACLEAAGLRRVKFHDLRHTFANLLIRQGTNVKYIQQQFGHSSISITLDVYSHLFDGDYRHQVSRLDDAPANADSTEVEKAKSATLAQPQRRDLKDLNSEPTKIIGLTDVGGVTERPNVPVLKTGDLARGPRVQISPPPPMTPVDLSLSSSCISAASDYRGAVRGVRP